MKNDKIPGPGGFTSGFLKVFWRDLGTFFTREINHSFKIGNFSEIDELGVITCIL